LNVSEQTKVGKGKKVKGEGKKNGIKEMGKAIVDGVSRMLFKSQRKKVKNKGTDKGEIKEDEEDWRTYYGP
jgi:hypothetical protein